MQPRHSKLQKRLGHTKEEKHYAQMEAVLEGTQIPTETAHQTLSRCETTFTL
jgi:hypothetical protein